MINLNPGMRLFALLCVTVTLGACGLFGDDDEELQPAELVDIKDKIDVKRLWSNKLGDDAEFLRLALRPGSDGNRVYATSSDGRVSAFEPNTGKRIWRTELDTPVSAGVGVGQGYVIVVSADGFVIALSAEDGSERWRADIKGESLAIPVITEGKVFIQTVDNRLRSLSLFDGRTDWTVIQSMPALTMRGTASPVVVGSSVVTGFDNGRLLAIDIESGATQWEALLAPPTGRSDLERLSDVDGAVVAVGQDIYAAGYNGRISSIAAESGQVLWSLEISSFEGLSADWNNVYTTQDEGIVISLARRTGAEDWRQDILLRREPTLPVPFLATVVVGDFEGYLHFFSNVDGEYLARERFGGSAISTAPFAEGENLYVQNDAGELAAYTILRPEPNRNEPAANTEEGS